MQNEFRIMRDESYQRLLPARFSLDLFRIEKSSKFFSGTRIRPGSRRSETLELPAATN